MRVQVPPWAPRLLQPHLSMRRELEWQSSGLLLRPVRVRAPGDAPPSRKIQRGVAKLVRHRVLTPTCAGSSPASSATYDVAQALERNRGTAGSSPASSSPLWWNWKTRWPQKPVAAKAMGVRPSPGVPLHSTRELRPSPGSSAVEQCLDKALAEGSIPSPATSSLLDGCRQVLGPVRIRRVCTTLLPRARFAACGHEEQVRKRLACRWSGQAVRCRAVRASWQDDVAAAACAVRAAEALRRHVLVVHHSTTRSWRNW